MADIVERHGATLNEFAGNGAMALFGVPLDRAPEDEVIAAVAAATEIQATLPVLVQRWFKLGLDHELRARVGINTGVLSARTFGPTNIAARIQAKCDPGAILISQASWHLVKDVVSCEERGEAEVKGVLFPIKLYAPVVAAPIEA